MAVGIEGGGREVFDYVVCTSPLTAFQRMTRSLPLPNGLADLKLDYQGVVSAVFLTKKPMAAKDGLPAVAAE